MSGSSSDFGATRHQAPREADLGQARMLFDDFGTLNTHALETVASPWKLYSVALLMAEAPKLGLPVERASLRPVLEQFGFLFPDSIGNWDARVGPPPRFDAPIGATRGMIHGLLPGIGLEVRNNGCATCHSGSLYDAQGLPTRTVWLGLPNTWIDFEGYAEAVFAGLKLGMRDERVFMMTMEHVYPDMRRGERFTYRHFVLPRLRRELKAIVAARDRALVFDNGGPGVTNGVGALKLQLGLISDRTYAAQEVGLTSIPNLADRAFRTSLLYDGTYVVRGGTRFRPVTRDEANLANAERHAEIVAFFTLGTAGNDAATAERMIPRMREVMRWLARYQPPPFPGVVDGALATQGAEVFASHCAACHGRYQPDAARQRLAEYPNRLVPQDAMDTDSVRWMLVDDSVLQWQASHPKHPFVRHVEAARTGGYVAPILTGLWASAPYMHNNSVPTLWHLMHPDERPARFDVGGHRLDYVRMGVALERGADGVWRYPGDYTPRSRPVVYDTSLPGRSNRGHNFPFSALSEDEKAAVLEYLKTL
jgi:mono/diheme cytochrome c family protein